MSAIIVIDFFADWCQPCRLQDPIMEKLKEEFDGKVEFKKINVDDGEGTELAKKYSIHAIPTLVIEKDEKLFMKYVGVTKLETLEKKIKEALG